MACCVRTSDPDEQCMYQWPRVTGTSIPSVTKFGLWACCKWPAWTDEKVTWEGVPQMACYVTIGIFCSPALRDSVGTLPEHLTATTLFGGHSDDNCQLWTLDIRLAIVCESFLSRLSWYLNVSVCLASNFQLSIRSFNSSLSTSIDGAPIMPYEIVKHKVQKHKVERLEPSVAPSSAKYALCKNTVDQRAVPVLTYQTYSCFTPPLGDPDEALGDAGAGFHDT